MVNTYKNSLYGRFSSVLDDKGRIILPSHLRRWVTPEDNVLVMTRGIDKCVFAFTLPNWDYYLHEMRNMPGDVESRLKFNRQMLAWATDCTVDLQGRVRVPQDLIEIAEITRPVVIYGSIDRIEIWAEHKFNAHLKVEDSEYNRNAMELFENQAPDRRKNQFPSNN
ncbi:MAG: hypothetical protein V2A61_02305 [Calditrichota bacterium]